MNIKLTLLSFIAGFLSFGVFAQSPETEGGEPTRAYLTVPIEEDVEFKSPISFIYKTVNKPDSITIPDPKGIPGESTHRVLTFKGSRVGIGTDNPEQKLHVSGGDALISGTLALGSFPANPAATNIKFQIGNAWTFSNTPYGKIMGYNCQFLNESVSGRYIDGYAAASAIRLNTNGSVQLCAAPYGNHTAPLNWNYFTMLNDGKVGIGTTNPFEAMQIGDIWTFHSGGTKYIGRNVKYALMDGTWKNVRIEPGYSSLISFSGNGNINLEAGGTGNKDSIVITTGKNLTLTAEGKVGIGTTNPLEAMQIGDIWTFHNGGDKIIGRNCYNDDGPNKRIQKGYASRIYFHRDGDIVMQTAPSGGEGSDIGGEWKTIVMKNSGTLAIGATNPDVTKKLHVQGDSYLTGALSIGTTSTTKKLNVQGDSYLSGTLGIGTTDVGNYKLRVNGMINCTQVVVTPTVPKGDDDEWPDYVFAEDYALRSLDEVASYIEENKRLPEIPSAAEVSKNGVNLLEINTLLLKKVEELTLYMLQQNEKMGDMQKQIDELRK